MNILPITFSLALTFYLFLFFLTVIPYFLKKKHLLLCLLVTFSTSLALAIISQSEFDFQERIVRGMLFGVIAFILGGVYRFFQKTSVNTDQKALTK